jgi:uncharacterized Tic20 family protein
MWNISARKGADQMNTRKVLSAVCHGSLWFSSVAVGIGVPLVVMLVSDDPIVKSNAKESINAHINLIVGFIVFGLLSMILIGIPFVIALGIYSLVMPLVAICAVAGSPDKTYRYPFMVHIINSKTDPLLTSEG